MKESDALEHGLTVHNDSELAGLPADDETIIALVQELKAARREISALQDTVRSQAKPMPSVKHAPVIKIGADSDCNVHPDALDIRVEQHESGSQVAWIPVMLGTHPVSERRTSARGYAYTRVICGTCTVKQSYASYHCHASDGTPLEISLSGFASITANTRMSPVETANYLKGHIPSADPRDHDDMEPSYSPDEDAIKGFQMYDPHSVRDAHEAPFIPSQAATSSTEQRPPSDSESCPFDPKGNLRRP